VWLADRVVSRIVSLIALAVLVTACTDADRPASTTADPANSAVTSTTITTTSTTQPLPDAAAVTTTLQGVVDDFVAAQSVPFSVVVVDLRTGARVEHLGDRQVRSASLYKLFVAREELRRIAAGALRRDAPANDGQGRTIDQCLEAMIVASDNACGVAGLNLVGRGALDAGLHQDDYVATMLSNPQRTSAEDIALFLTRAHNGTLLGPDGGAQSAELYALLARQQVNDRLPTGLPPGTPIAHKTGDIIGWAHDAGVITTPHGDVVLAVLSGPWPAPCCDADHPGEAERVAFGAIADLGRRVYEVLA
jgi:beta-lactamase class A